MTQPLHTGVKFVAAVVMIVISVVIIIAAWEIPGVAWIRRNVVATRVPATETATENLRPKTGLGVVTRKLMAGWHGCPNGWGSAAVGIKVEPT